MITVIEAIVYDKPAVMRLVFPFADFNCRKICACWVRSKLFMKSIVVYIFIANLYFYNTQNDSASLPVFFFFYVHNVISLLIISTPLSPSCEEGVLNPLPSPRPFQKGKGCNRPPVLGTATLNGWRTNQRSRHIVRDGTAWR